VRIPFKFKSGYLCALIAGAVLIPGCAFKHQGTGSALQELQENYSRKKVLKEMGEPDEAVTDQDFELLIYSNRDEEATSGWQAFAMFSEAFAEGYAGNQMDPEKYAKVKNHYYIVLRDGVLIHRGLGKISEKRFKRWVRNRKYDEETLARRKLAGSP
jgi:hypothetical protein